MYQVPEKYRALIFDMDGTLIDSGQLHEFAWTQALESFGLPVDAGYMRSLAGVPTELTVKKIVERFGVKADINPTEVSVLKASIVEEVYSRFVKPTALVELVQQYKTVLPMAIGTGASTAEAEAVLEACGLRHEFACIVGSDQVDHGKPAPDTFLRCARLMNVAAEECVVFEDASHGIAAAEAAGMLAIDVAQRFSITNDYFLRRNSGSG